MWDDWKAMGGTEMIEIQKNYKLTLTEEQAKELYQFLRTEKDIGRLGVDKDLKLIYDELKNIFETGMR
jgi:uncharacterized protein YpuA (DUF1002 family)